MNDLFFLTFSDILIIMLLHLPKRSNFAGSEMALMLVIDHVQVIQE